jgi:hypothetical protein
VIPAATLALAASAGFTEGRLCSPKTSVASATKSYQQSQPIVDALSSRCATLRA